VKGDYVDSFVSKNLLPEEGGAVDSETEENIKWAGAALYVGGGDTVCHNQRPSPWAKD